MSVGRGEEAHSKAEPAEERNEEMVGGEGETGGGVGGK